MARAITMDDKKLAPSNSIAKILLGSLHTPFSQKYANWQGSGNGLHDPNKPVFSFALICH